MLLWNLPAKFEVVLNKDHEILHFCIYILELFIWNVIIREL